jgi:nucleotide-binding universal stress UspA family protein
MKNIKKILLPIKFTEDSYKVVRTAAEIAKIRGARLIMLHVFHRPIIRSSENKLLDMQMSGQMEKFELSRKERRIRRQYAQLLAAVPELDRIDHSFITRIGTVVNSIRDISEKQGADLIIMGSGAMGGGARFMSGKAVTVSHQVKTPVLILPYQHTITRPFKIAFAYDMKAIQNFESLQTMGEISRHYNSNLNIVTVRRPGETFNSQQEANLQNLLAEFADLNPDVQIIEHDDMENGIVQYLRHNQISILVILQRSRGIIEELFQSTMTKKVIRRTAVPVLALDE